MEGPASRSAESSVVPVGRREANKREKLARIRAAARAAFLEKGFEATTVRDIAAGAGVALGTLFLYAKDKRDLLLLLYDDELEALTERATRRADRAAPLVDQLIAFFFEFYRFFRKTPQLSRQMMREITFTDGMVARRIWDGVQATERRVAEILQRAQDSGALSREVAPALAAHILFCLYRTEIRFCFAADRPDVRRSVANLRSQFEVVCHMKLTRSARSPFDP